MIWLVSRLCRKTFLGKSSQSLFSIPWKHRCLRLDGTMSNRGLDRCAFLISHSVGGTMRREIRDCEVQVSSEVMTVWVCSMVL